MNFFKVTPELVIALFWLPFTSIAQASFRVHGPDAVLKLMSEHHVPAVGIGVIESGQVRAVKVYGDLDGKSAPENTLFNIASLTKPLVSTLTLKLVSQGNWKLDEPLSNYWTDPDVEADPRHLKLTTRHVLSHKSGLPNWRGHEPGNKLSFAFEPGTEWKYSGEGFEYLRQALEHKFKIPIDVLADSLLFKPAGMSDTRFYWDQHVDPARYANRHGADGTPYEVETWTTANASNLVLTTVNDYCKFGIDVLNGSGLTMEMAAEMVKTQAKLNNGNAFGLGWVIVSGLINDEYALVHTGRNPGINAIIVLLPKSKSGIVIFTNGDNGDQLYKTLISTSSAIGKELVERTSK